jgi:hypothetical protein
MNELPSKLPAVIRHESYHGKLVISLVTRRHQVNTVTTPIFNAFTFPHVSPSPFILIRVPLS